MLHGGKGYAFVSTEKKLWIPDVGVISFWSVAFIG